MNVTQWFISLGYWNWFIAAAILFLSCGLSAYVNGQTLVVDGGVSAKFPYPRPPSED